MSKLFVSGFPANTTERQIEDLFLKEGRIIFSDIDVQKGQGYLEYDDLKNAQKAIESLHDSTQFGNKIKVELSTVLRTTDFKPTHFKKFKNESYSRSRSKSSSRSYSRGRRHSRHQKSNINNNQSRPRKLPTSRDKCYVCGKYGHWASKCKEGDGSGVSSGKCFKCGERGHIARKCPNFRKKSSYNSFSRSGSRSGSYSSKESRHKRRSPSQSSRSNSSKDSKRSASSDASRKNKRKK